MHPPDFVYQAPPARVVLGPGRCATVAEEIDQLGKKRVLLVADRNSPALEQLRELLAERLVGHWDALAQHVPVELAERARATADALQPDCVLTLGGGSATGLAKALALSHDLPVVAIPTTYAGSEMTPIYGLTGGVHKQTGRDPRVRPVVVIYDPELTTDLPAAVTGPSAFNAIAHCVAALSPPHANPLVTALALESVRAIRTSLRTVITEPRDIAGRGMLQYGAFLAGMVMADTSTGLHHKLCHALGGMLDLAHADTHSVILPHVVAFNAPALPTEMARLADALGRADTDPAGQLADLAAETGVATDLARLGMREEHQAPIAERVAGIDNVVPVTTEAAERLLERARQGERPASNLGSF